MSDEEPQFYDNAAVFQIHMQHRQRVENPNDTLEKPFIVELRGNVHGAHILDRGGGDATWGAALLGRGATVYLGLDGSQNMVEHATRHLAETVGQVLQADIWSWVYPRHAFDTVLARLVLHYIDDVNHVFQRAFQTLRTGGRFIFSVEHPVITSCDRAWEEGDMRQCFCFWRHGTAVISSAESRAHTNVHRTRH